MARRGDKALAVRCAPRAVASAALLHAPLRSPPPAQARSSPGCSACCLGPDMCSSYTQRASQVPSLWPHMSLAGPPPTRLRTAYHSERRRAHSARSRVFQAQPRQQHGTVSWQVYRPPLAARLHLQTFPCFCKHQRHQAPLLPWLCAWQRCAAAAPACCSRAPIRFCAVAAYTHSSAAACCASDGRTAAGPGCAGVCTVTACFHSGSRLVAHMHRAAAHAARDKRQVICEGHQRVGRHVQCAAHHAQLRCSLLVHCKRRLRAARMVYVGIK